MVDFTLTDEQNALREMAHDFAVKEIRPVAWEYDKDGAWPEDVLRKAWEIGLMNSHVPEEYGGSARCALPRWMHHRGGALLGLFRHHHVARRQRPRLRAAVRGRLRGAQEAVPR